MTKVVKPPVQTNEIFYGGTASLLLSTPTAVVLYDIQQQKTLAEINSPPVKYAIWNTDSSMVALLSKHSKHLMLLYYHRGLQTDSYYPRQQNPCSESSDPRDYQN